MRSSRTVRRRLTSSSERSRRLLAPIENPPASRVGNLVVALFPFVHKRKARLFERFEIAPNRFGRYVAPRRELAQRLAVSPLNQPDDLPLADDLSVSGHHATSLPGKSRGRRIPRLAILSNRPAMATHGSPDNQRSR